MTIFVPILFGFQEHDWGDFLIETWNHIPKSSKWWRFKKMAGFLQKLQQRCVKTCWREDNWGHFKSLCECEICIIISRSKSCIIVLLKFLSESVNIFFFNPVTTQTSLEQNICTFTICSTIILTILRSQNPSGDLKLIWLSDNISIFRERIYQKWGGNGVKKLFSYFTSYKTRHSSSLK